MTQTKPSRFTFWTVWFFFIVVFQGLEIAVSIWLRQNAGVRDPMAFVGGLAVLNVVLARFCTDRLLKRLGLSQSGKVFEVQGRAAHLSYEPGVGDGVLVIYASRSLCQFLIVMSLVMAGFLSVLAGVVPSQSIDHVEYIYLLIPLPLAGAGFGWWLMRRPIIAGDSEGIRCYRQGSASLSQVWVPWSKVATCELKTIYDTFGQPAVTLPTLKGPHGEVLLAVDVQSIDRKDQDRLVKFIKTRLPKPQVDAWEL